MEQMEVQADENLMNGNEDTSQDGIIQAAVFIEDAAQYRSIHHKIDSKSLWMYRWYYSKPIRWGYTFIIFLYLMLAFVEKPSSLTLSSDPRFRGPRPDPPCGVTETLEIIFLICFVCDLVVKSHLLGRQQVIKNRWLLSYCAVLIISFIDVFVTLSTGCSQHVRIHRLLRPFFLLQNSSLMKKLLRAIKRTVPEILSVLFLLLLHLWFFTMCGMLFFPQASRQNSTLASHQCDLNTNDSASGAACEGYKYFSRLEDSLRSLLVLLTTANNPDVMMPAYMKNRYYAIFFITFTVIGLYFFLNMLTAVIYNQFRGYLTSSLQASFFRRRVGIRAAFVVLLQIQDVDSDVPLGNISCADAKRAIENANIGKRSGQNVLARLAVNPSDHLTAKQFQDLFEVLDGRGSRSRHRPAMSYVQHPLLRKIQILVSSKCFDYVGDFVAAVNVLLVSILLDYEYDKIWKNTNSDLAVANFFFVLYYLLEQLMKLWALGLQRYRSYKGNVYCGFITLLLVVLEIVHAGMYGLPFSKSSSNPPFKDMDRFFSLANMIRIINMLIIFRLLRIVPNITSLSLIVETLMKLLKHLRPFGGIIVAVYYVFAVLGMMLFDGVTNPATVGANKTRLYSQECGTFDQLQYYANNFDDFGAALVVLWDLMVVNNWHVFLKEYATVVNGWAQLYFVAWYLISVILIINLFVALILEAFISQWEIKQQRSRQNSLSSLATEATSHVGGRFHQLFGSNLVEPAEEDLLNEIRGHIHYGILSQSTSENRVNYRL